jgi:hypothetical protein
VTEGGEWREEGEGEGEEGVSILVGTARVAEGGRMSEEEVRMRQAEEAKG